MASATKKTENKRQSKMRSNGKWNRRQRRNKGTTPVFPIHVEKAPEGNAQA